MKVVKFKMGPFAGKTCAGRAASKAAGILAALVLPWLMEGAETPREISILSWNTEHYGFERRPQKERVELERNMFELIRAVDPDIFLMQETYGSFERFKAAFPHHHAVLQSACNAVFSKYPLGETRRLWTDRMAQVPPVFNTPILSFTDVYAGDLRLRISSFAMFWQPLCVRIPADQTADELLAWEASPQPYPLTPRPQAIREALAATAGLLSEKDRIPLVIGGDFNSLSHQDWTPANGRAEGHGGRVVAWPVSREMARAGFTDAYRAVHPDEVKEPGATHPMPGCDARHPNPLNRIDYIYCAGPALKPVAAETIRGRYHKPFEWRGRAFSMFPSDHAPVLVRFAVVGNTRSSLDYNVGGMR